MKYIYEKDMFALLVGDIVGLIILKYVLKSYEPNYSGTIIANEYNLTKFMNLQRQ